MDEVSESLKKTFRPEFLNRIDEVIVFHQLKIDDVKRIVDIQMREIQSRMADQNLRIELSDAAKGWLAERGYDRTFGARPLRSRHTALHREPPLATLAGQRLRATHAGTGRCRGRWRQADVRR